MAKLIAFNTVENGKFGVVRVIAKSGERITFPEPSEVSDPEIWVNVPNGNMARVERCSNISCSVKYVGKGPTEILIRYGLKKSVRS